MNQLLFLLLFFKILVVRSVPIISAPELSPTHPPPQHSHAASPDGFAEMSIDKRDLAPRDQRYCKGRHGEKVPAGPPRFLDQENLAPLKAGVLGLRFELSCPYISCPPAHVSWRKDGKDVKERSKPGRSTIRRDDSKGTLNIENNREEDDGNYTCVVSNPRGRISHTIEVKSAVRYINAPPDLKQELANQTVPVGSNITLACEPTFFDSTNIHEISWFKHHSVNGSWSYLDEKNATVYYKLRIKYSEDNPPPSNASQLGLTNLQVNDTGYYSCEIRNDIAKKESMAFITVANVQPDTNWAMVIVGVVLTVLIPLLIVSWGFVWYSARIAEKATGKPVLIKSLLSKKVVVNRYGGSYSLSPDVQIVKLERKISPDEDSLPDLVTEYVFQEDDIWEFPRENLKLLGTLGEGQFGKVVEGSAIATISGDRLQVGGSSCCTVAVKMVKEGHTDSDIIDLVKEAEIMKVIGQHDNIINLLGVCSQPVGQPLLVIVEYAKHGNLRDFLRLRRESTERLIRRKNAPFPGSIQLSHPNDDDCVSLKMMFSFALQVAKGMEFLSSRRCVHRDLAARNVLVAEGGVAKVADFGMARDLQDSDYYCKRSSGRIPMLWTAPESLVQRKYTPQSDVWSYGILLWEVVTFGEQPYRCLSRLLAVNVQEFPQAIQNGYRMNCPAGCPDNLYALMRHCWLPQPEQRPVWRQLVETMYQLHVQMEPGRYLDLPAPCIPTPESTPLLTRAAETTIRCVVAAEPLPTSYVAPDSPTSTTNTWPNTIDQHCTTATTTTTNRSSSRDFTNFSYGVMEMDHEAAYLDDVSHQQQQCWSSSQQADSEYRTSPPLPTGCMGSCSSDSEGEEVGLELLEEEGSSSGLTPTEDLPTPLAGRTFVRSVSGYGDRMGHGRQDSESEVEDRQGLLSPGRMKKRGSSESGYGTNRESESSDTRFPYPSLRKLRHISDDDSVFERD